MWGVWYPQKCLYHIVNTEASLKLHLSLYGLDAQDSHQQWQTGLLLLY